MFELKVITSSNKPFETIESKHNLFQIIEGKAKLFRISSETCTLTDKFEFFRFLPIKRTNILFIIGIPSECTEENFISFLGSSIQKIQSVIFIKNPHTKFVQVIISFDLQDSADNFYYNFNTKYFPQNKSEFLYCAFIVDVTYLSNEESLTLSPTKSEMVTCPLCIEKLEARCSGIETVVNLFPCERWVNYKTHCIVCSKLSKHNKDKLKCIKCSNESDLWCCLVCGYLGCNRYQERHAIEHYERTSHRYSIEINTQRIWDYLYDTWIHRMIKSEENSTLIIFDEMNEERPTSKEFLSRMENVIEEYNEVLGSQLDVQRNFYELEVERMKDKYELMLKGLITKGNNIKEELNKKEKMMAFNYKLINDCSKKTVQQDKKIKEMKDNIDFNQVCIDELKNNKLKTDTNNNKPIKNEDKINLLENKKKRKMELQRELEDGYSQLSNNN